MGKTVWRKKKIQSVPIDGARFPIIPKGEDQLTGDVKITSLQGHFPDEKLTFPELVRHFVERTIRISERKEEKEFFQENES
ncbi:hypothetical protein TNCV_1800281 [Trichonephila clavipes]|nr:hypothetical protein TNCV_1800281 [Trichonephila clavipes]